MDYCEFFEECRNKDSYKCNNCEYNKNNFEAIEREENLFTVNNDSPKKYYKYANHYEPL